MKQQEQVLTYTVGSFLREKLRNMSTWLQGEGLSSSLDMSNLQEVQVVALAQILHDKFADAIKTRTFEPLEADKENIPLDVLKIVQHVKENPALHDKFWRYLKLFSDTVSR